LYPAAFSDILISHPEIRMLSHYSGFKSEYGGLTVLVVAEFNEWKVLAYAPGVTIHGTRQFTEATAKAHAISMAQAFLREQRQQDIAALGDVNWEPTGDQDWLMWR
jgi:hypothetical protein